MRRTYRVQVTGQFDRPTGPIREQLLAEQAEHEVTASAFVPDGTFSYTPSLTRFTLRYLLEADEPSAAEADAMVELEGELRATAYLDQRNVPFHRLSTSVTCLDDVKVRRRV